MTRHLLKLVWNRRRTNLLVVAEIFCSFLVLFGVVTLGVFYLDNYRQPLGFQGGDDVWVVMLNAPQGGPGGPDTEHAAVAWRLLAATREFPEVLAAAGAFTMPYSNAGWNNAMKLPSGPVENWINQVSDGYAEVMGLRVVRGRWFSREDDGARAHPVVVTSAFAQAVYGDEDPIGRVLPDDPPPAGEPPRPQLRVVGVIDAFRQHGEFSEPVYYSFRRFDPQDLEPSGLSDGTRAGPAVPRLIAVKVRPGTPASFEATLISRLHAEAHDWSFEVETLAQARESFLRDRLTPLVAVAVVAAFLMLMVALGLTGVVWQNVTQRTREIGLRRAKGATAGRIHRQIVGELLLMTTLALAAGLIVVVQFPLLDLVAAVRPAVYAVSLALSTAAVYCLALVFGWYPSRLATTVMPAEALRYE
jgi:putative ABC transport system permease protein